MKQKAVLLTLAFILMLLPLAMIKGLNAEEVAPEVLSDNVQPLNVQEVSLDEVKAFSDSFKWDSLDTRKLALYAIEIAPANHKATALYNLTVALDNNLLNKSDRLVTKDLFFKAVSEIVPPKILPGVLKILKNAK